MSENKNIEKLNHEELSQELENTKNELTKANEIIAQYEAAYKELQSKYNKLYGLLGNTIEYSISVK